MRLLALVPALALLLAAGCSGDSTGSKASPAATTAGSAAATRPAAASPSASASATAMNLSSPAFTDGGNIPAEYSCDGKSTSPEIDWMGAPLGTKALALVLHDPDAPRSGGFTHWVVYNIPPSAAMLNAGASPNGTLPQGTLEGQNGSGKPGYTGPCPPAGAPHHYQFTLYALDVPLSLPAGKAKSDLEAAVNGHVLATAQLTGLYGRK